MYGGGLKHTYLFAEFLRIEGYEGGRLVSPTKPAVNCKRRNSQHLSRDTIQQKTRSAFYPKCPGKGLLGKMHCPTGISSAHKYEQHYLTRNLKSQSNSCALRCYFQESHDLAFHHVTAGFRQRSDASLHFVSTNKARFRCVPVGPCSYIRSGSGCQAHHQRFQSSEYSRRLSPLRRLCCYRRHKTAAKWKWMQSRRLQLKSACQATEDHKGQPGRHSTKHEENNNARTCRSLVFVNPTEKSWSRRPSQSILKKN